jgi:hypothetical protein
MWTPGILRVEVHQQRGRLGVALGVSNIITHCLRKAQHSTPPDLVYHITRGESLTRNTTPRRPT